VTGHKEEKDIGNREEKERDVSWERKKGRREKQKRARFAMVATRQMYSDRGQKEGVKKESLKKRGKRD